MGLLAKAVTSQRSKPQGFVAGRWVQSLVDETDGVLDAAHARYLAIHRALLDTDPGGATSYFTFSNEKRISSATSSVRRRKVMMRADVNNLRISCGAPGHGWLTTDWALQASLKPEGNAIEMVRRRTIDGAIVNAPLLNSTRQAIARVMAEGPGKVTVTRGGFNLGNIVERRVMDDRSLFYGDHVYPVPADFRAGARIELPSGSREAVLKVLDTLPFTALGMEQGPSITLGDGRSIRIDGEHSINLDGGRGVTDCSVAFQGSAANPSLVLHLPADEGSTSRQRTFRAALYLINYLGAKLVAEHKPAADAVLAWVGKQIEGRDDPARIAEFEAMSGKTEPIGAVVLKPGGQLPLLTEIISSCTPVQIDAFLRGAEAWVLPRERSFTQGIRQAARDKNRRYTRRGPAQLQVDNKTLRTYRYSEYQPQSYRRHTFTTDQSIWFWQVNAAITELEGGLHKTVLWVSSLSRHGDILCYAQELARYSAAFEAQLLAIDPGAKLSTASLTL